VGRLAVAAQPACVLSWLISDVPNDDPGVHRLCPTVADRTTFADALAVLRQGTASIHRRPCAASREGRGGRRRGDTEAG